MAGRGRGRGRGSFSFETGALGFGKGEALPSAILQPPQLYPVRTKICNPRVNILLVVMCVSILAASVLYISIVGLLP